GRPPGGGGGGGGGLAGGPGQPALAVQEQAPGMAKGVRRREEEKAGAHGAEQQRENRHERGLRVGRDVTGVVAQVLLLGGAASVGGRTLIMTLASVLSLAPVPALACV